MYWKVLQILGQIVVTSFCSSIVTMWWITEGGLRGDMTQKPKHSRFTSRHLFPAQASFWREKKACFNIIRASSEKCTFIWTKYSVVNTCLPAFSLAWSSHISIQMLSMVLPDTFMKQPVILNSEGWMCPNTEFCPYCPSFEAIKTSLQTKQNIWQLSW